MNQCKNCGAPMIQMIMSWVCRAECDLKPAIKAEWDPFEVFMAGQTLVCLDGRRGFQIKWGIKPLEHYWVQDGLWVLGRSGEALVHRPESWWRGHQAQYCWVRGKPPVVGQPPEAL